MTNETTNQPEEIKTPKWLKKLEQESWQAELIVSGLAIYGSLKLPDAVIQLGSWAINNMAPGALIRTGIWYLYIATIIIASSFIFHFILRAIWIGFIGLNSVFPKGINREGSKNYSIFFMDFLVKDYPNNQSIIQRLDNFCSSIFASSAYIGIMLSVLSFDIAILLGIKYLLSFFIPENILDFIGILILILLSGISVFSMFCNLKRNHSNQKLQSIYYKIYQWYTKMLFHIFQRPANYLLFIFLTNISFKEYFKGATAIFIPIMALASYQFVNTEGIYLLAPERLYQSFERLDRTQAYFYKDELIENNLSVFSPFIERKKIDGPLMEVFIPIHGNESDMIDKVCGEWTKIDSLERKENRQLKYAFYYNCYHQYHRIYLNDSLYQTEYSVYKLPYKKIEGIITYLPTDHLKNGKNILTVEKIANEPDSVFRKAIIPFWFTN